MKKVRSAWYRSIWRVIEGLLLAGIVLAHWFPDPSRLQSSLLFLPLFAGRCALAGRLITRTPLDPFLVGFILLCLANVALAPHTWGIYVVSRALMGAGIVWVIGDWGRPLRGSGRSAIPDVLGVILIGFGGLVAIAALLTAQWTVKSAFFQPILALLPRVRDFALLPGGINVNEISGALTLVTPIAAAFVLANGASARPIRWIAGGALLLLSAALLLAQSRFAIAGVLASGVMLAFALVPAGTRRRVLLALLGAVLIFEAALVGGLLNPPEVSRVTLIRDEDSLTARLNIWRAGAAILLDHPLTGVGINQFRSRAVRAVYPVPGYESSVLPHAHNLALQTGADLGLPGILVAVGWTVGLAILLRRVRRRGDPSERAAAVGIGAGILAFLVFSIGDAITLFDRFIFLYWLVIAWGTALAVRLDTTSR